MIQPNIDSAAMMPAARARANDLVRTSRSAAGLTEEKSALTALVVRAAAGDPQAESALFRKYSHRISGFVRTIVRSCDAVDDVTQTVFIKMFRRLGRLRDPASFEPWLFTMARTTALDFLRHQRRRIAMVSIADNLLEVSDGRTDDASAEILEALEAALVQLPAATCTLITLFVQGHSYITLAAQSGISLGAVKARLHRARPVLRACVGAAIEGRRPAYHAMPDPAAAGR